jgi:hypothetical protein
MNSDDYVEGHDAVGKAWHIPIVMLSDPAVRGRLHLPLIDDDDRAKLSGRQAKQSHLEARDWMLVLLMLASIIISLVAVLKGNG